MAKEHTSDLLQCLTPFKPEVVDLAMWLRDFAWDLCPEANELIYDNYNAVAVGWSPTDKVGHIACSMAVGRTNQSVHFGFYWGSELSDPDRMLLGQGKQYRYIVVKDKASFPAAYITRLVNEAYINSLAKVKDPKQLRQGMTILKSVSEKKRGSK